jgi:predicted ATPase/Tfp pilus assembly protein PilF
VSDVLPAGFVNILAAVPMAEGMAVGDASRVRDLVARVASEHAGVEVPSAPRSRSGLVMGFGRARDAAASATAIQRAARREGLALALGIHSIPPGNPSPGPAATSRHPDVERAIWLAAVGHAGQVVLSRESRDLLREAPLHEVDVRDLGEHRLADLAPAQPLFQLVARGLDVDFPPTRGLEARPTNLPVQATRFIDREAELDAIVALLQDPAIRLLTLTGPGGTGKTRLALHAAAELLDEVVDGAWFVPLDGLSNPDLLGPAIATVLGVGEDGAATAQTAPVRELRDKRVLLVLDNFEHLLGASAVVADLLAGTSGLKVLVTSRAPLRLESERAFAVPPLPSPPADARLEVQEMLRIGAVALFDARARTARPSFSLTADNAQVVAQLCRALDGLPLAIELAASRVALMPPEAVLDRLDRPLRLLTSRMRPGPKRHRALEAAIDWTHELLEPAVQRLFAGLAAFAGGWTLDAAEAVCDDGLDVIDGLAGLVDHSLVRVDTAGAAPRFGMLETIREYAVTRLDASGQGLQIERRHAAFYLALAESAEPHLRGNPGEWVARLETEHNNLRAALDRLAATGNAATQARLAGALWRFWYLAGHLREGRARLEHAVAVHPEPTAARAKVLIGAAVMAVNTGDAAVARERAADALALTRSLGDAWSAAYAQFMLATAASSEGDDDTARSAYEASLRAFRALGDEHSALLVSRNLGGTLEDLGDLDAARTLYQDNLRRARADRNGRLEASTLGALATIAFDEGRVIDANLMLRESLRLHRELGDRLDTAVDLARAARTLAMAGRAEEAARLHGAVQAIRDQLGIRGQTVGAMGSDTLAALRRQLDDTALTRLVGEGDRLPLDGAVGLALDALA